jgi:hypothetical protein
VAATVSAAAAASAEEDSAAVAGADTIRHARPATSSADRIGAIRGYGEVSASS